MWERQHWRQKERSFLECCRCTILCPLCMSPMYLTSANNILATFATSLLLVDQIIHKNNSSNCSLATQTFMRLVPILYKSACSTAPSTFTRKSTFTYNPTTNQSTIDMNSIIISCFVVLGRADSCGMTSEDPPLLTFQLWRRLRPVSVASSVTVWATRAAAPTTSLAPVPPRRASDHVAWVSIVTAFLDMHATLFVPFHPQKTVYSASLGSYASGTVVRTGYSSSSSCTPVSTSYATLYCCSDKDNCNGAVGNAASIFLAVTLLMGTFYAKQSMLAWTIVWMRASVFFLFHRDALSMILTDWSQ